MNSTRGRGLSSTHGGMKRYTYTQPGKQVCYNVVNQHLVPSYARPCHGIRNTLRRGMRGSGSHATYRRTFSLFRMAHLGLGTNPTDMSDTSSQWQPLKTGTAQHECQPHPCKSVRLRVGVRGVSECEARSANARYNRARAEGGP